MGKLELARTLKAPERTVQYNIRLTESERDRMVQAAKKTGRSIRRFMTAAVLDVADSCSARNDWRPG